jgi:hypothetical protein
MAMELAARPWITAGVALVLPTLQQVIADLLDGKQIDLQAAGNAAVTPFLPGSGLPPVRCPLPTSIRRWIQSTRWLTR